MTARRPRLDEASEVYVKRVVATFPPFSESDKLHLSRLVTPPRYPGKSSDEARGTRKYDDAA